MLMRNPLLFPSTSTNHQHLSFVGFLIILVLPFSTLVDADCNPIDKASLLSFATNFPTLNWYASIDCCSRDGISCDAKGYRVVGLSIPERGLHGAIHSSLRNLTYLSFLNLSYNFLSGPLPDGLFSSFDNLHTIDLSYNRLSGYFPDTLPATVRLLNLSSNHFSGTIQAAILRSLQSLIGINIRNKSFTGSIPASICNTSPALVFIDFSLNDLTGNIPKGFGACSNLMFLSLGFNNLTGPIPIDICGAISLQELLLHGNSLTGEISENITDLANLRSLVLFGNMLSGSIPHNIGKLSLLERLELHINRLNGTLPMSLMNCTKLQVLNLRVNSLSGRLSDYDFSNFSQLRIVDLGNNGFIGLLPKSLFSCKSLTAIRLVTNKLDGEILPGVLELPSLSFFSLSNNSFKNITQALNILSGHKNITTLLLSKNFFNETLPSTGLSGFLNLKIMGLGGCKLFGQIPIWLMSLTNLEILDLSQNNINGKIPGGLQILSNLYYLDLSNNFLSGSFPVELTRLPALASQQVLDQLNSTYTELPVFVAPQNTSHFQYNQLTTFNLENLEKLDLSYNLLSGVIPSSLKHLYFLSFFKVANNNLQGSIPTSGQFDTFSDQNYEGNRGLCGPPMQKSCSKQSDLAPPSSSSSLGHWRDVNTEMIGGPILGFCFGFGIILTCQTFCMVSKRRILPRVIHKYFIWA